MLRPSLARWLALAPLVSVGVWWAAPPDALQALAWAALLALLQMLWYLAQPWALRTAPAWSAALVRAAPPLLGWVAVTGHVTAEPLLLVLIIFAWTPPHFWALAIHRKEEYAKADIPMLPVTHGEHYTKVHIVLYTLVLLAVSLLPFVIHMSGLLYLVCALGLGARFLHWAWVLYRGTQPHAAINTFKYSIYYLFLLFIALLVDHYLMLNL